MYGNPVGYDRYMGRLSTALAPGFLRFACAPTPGEESFVLDLGCGTGSLLRATAEALPQARFLVGLDPVLAFVAHAQAALRLGRARFVVGSAQALPFTDGTFDYCLSLLVLQELRAPMLALGEMCRVTRQGGIVAACQWDFAGGMLLAAALREAIAVVAPETLRVLDSGAARAFASEAELRAQWEAAGLREVETSRLGVEVRYGSFAELWQPLLGGSTPTSALVAALPPEPRDAVRRKVQRRILSGHPDGPFALHAEAFAVRGRVAA